MASNNTIKDIVNGLYSGSLIAIGVVGTRLATRELGLKNLPVDMSPKSLAMLGAEISVSTMAVQKLQDSNVLPSKIIN